MTVSHRARVLVAVVLAVTGVVGAIRAIAPAFSHRRSWQRADITADWVVTEGAWTGHDPYGQTNVLARDLGTTVVDRAAIGGAAVEAPHPRPPGAFIVLAPLALVRGHQAYLVSAWMNVILFFVLALLAAYVTRKPLRWALVGVAITLNAMPARDALNWGTLSFLMAALVIATFAAARDADRRWAGIPLGLAAALKLFPLGLVLPLLFFGRRRTGVGALITFAACTLGGLALPAVHIGGAVHALVGASDAWIGSPGNASIAGLAVQAGLTPKIATVLSLAFAAAVTYVVMTRVRGWQHAYWAMALVVLLVSPISWRHYDGMVAMGAVLVLFEGDNLRATMLAGAWIAIAVVASGLFGSAFELNHYGQIGLLERLLLMFAFASAYLPRTAPYAGAYACPPTPAFAAVAGD